MSTTYDLAREADLLLAALDDAGGELTAESEASWTDWLQRSGSKVESLHAVHRSAASKIELLSDDVKRLQSRVASLKKTQERVKNLGMELMTAHTELTGETKLTLPGLTVWVKESSRVVGPDDATDWPADYQRIKTSIEADKEKAKDAIRSGASIQGVRLEPTRSLQWK